MRKKLLCILITLALAAVMMPMATMTAFADEPDYLCFTAQENNSSVTGIIKGSLNVNLEYKVNDDTWEAYPINTGVNLNNGDKLYFKGSDNGGFFLDNDNRFYFSMTGSIAASGNIMTLLNGSEPDSAIITTQCFSNLFERCESLTSAPQLPATTMVYQCYSSMFYKCKNLTTAPDLPATTLAEGCYTKMFYECENLTTAPDLPATTLAEDCYVSMFSGCSSLATAPELPASTLAARCYNAMFQNCTKLTSVPDLKETQLPLQCYQNMFKGCSSIIITDTKPTSTCWSEFKIVGTPTDRSCLDNMFSGAEGTIATPNVNTTYYIAKSPHTPIEQAAVEPKCTLPGIEKYWKCETCGKIYEDECCEKEITDLDQWKLAGGNIDALGHDPKYIPKRYSTETEYGVKEYWYCTRCENYFSDSECTKEIGDATLLNEWKTNAGKIERHTHQFGTPDYIWDDNTKTCKGYHTCTVTDCGFIESESASMSNSGDEYTATFTKTGFTEQKKTYADTHTHSYGTATYIWNEGLTECTAYHTCTDASCNHTELETVTAQTKEGKKTATFTISAFEEQVKDIPTTPHVHTPTLVAGQAATCTENGFEACYKCSDNSCGLYFTDPACTEGSQIGNSVAYANWKIGDGKIEKIGHSFITIPQQDATLSKDGVKAYKYCGNCKQYYNSEGTLIGNVSDLESWKTGAGKIAASTPHSHDYGDATYIWHDGLDNCTAYKKCVSCEYTLIENVKTTQKDNTYTADFSEAFTDQTKTVAVDSQDTIAAVTGVALVGATAATAVMVKTVGALVSKANEAAKEAEAAKVAETAEVARLLEKAKAKAVQALEEAAGGIDKSILNSYLDKGSEAIATAKTPAEVMTATVEYVNIMSEVKKIVETKPVQNKLVAKDNGKIKVSFDAVELDGILGYQIKRATDKGFTENVKYYFNNEKTVRNNAMNLEKGTRYYFKVRAKVQLSDGEYAWTDWSNVRFVKCKKTR